MFLEFRNQVGFHKNQRGFVKGIPGSHVNARIMDAILKDAKTKKKSAVVAFLDVVGAFDNTGHQHITKSLEAKGISPDLLKLILALLIHNKVQIHNGGRTSGAIHIKRGVPQGGPLSPTLFNLAIDYIYKEICDSAMTDKFGYKLNKEEEGVILTGFADDQAVSSSSVKGAERIIDLVRRLLKEIGLDINSNKSTAIVLKNGALVKTTLTLESSETITSASENEVIKYLGCTFSGELVVNEDSIKVLTENLNKLMKSSLLKPDQKLNVLNQYIFPTLTYPLQTAPLVKLSPSLLEGVDVIIRRSVKAIIGLPANASTAMIYAPRRYRGLGVLRCEWEVPLQHISIAEKLARVDDSLFQSIFDYNAEIEECTRRLSFESDFHNSIMTTSPKRIRQSLREESFEAWAASRWQGVGVHHFKESTKFNKFIYNKQVLSSSEWTNGIKLNINYAPLRGVPGVAAQSSGDVGPLCRRCGRETETPAHVLGICPHSMLLVTRRHHRVKHKIMELLKSKNYTCFEEVYAVDSDGSPRYADIIAFKQNSNLAFIVDPTVRFESNDVNQAANINEEKRKIYEKCVKFYSEKFRDQFGDREYHVRGLWFGARGTVPRTTCKFFEETGIDTTELLSLAEEILVDSVSIIAHHVNNL